MKVVWGCEFTSGGTKKKEAARRESGLKQQGGVGPRCCPSGLLLAFLLAETHSEAELGHLRVGLKAQGSRVAAHLSYIVLALPRLDFR